MTTETVVDHVANGLWGSSSATFDPDRTYRYALTRCWDPGLAVITFVMLNPSTADAFAVDPTVRRCLDFARREGAGTLQVVNLFALRSTDPRVLCKHPDPVGALNDRFIADAATGSDLVIAGWGTHGILHGRGEVVRGILSRAGAARLCCLRITRGGHPGHPLYIPAAAPLIDFAAGVGVQ
jgi:hypothetical protein